MNAHFKCIIQREETNFVLWTLIVIHFTLKKGTIEVVYTWAFIIWIFFRHSILARNLHFVKISPYFRLINCNPNNINNYSNSRIFTVAVKILEATKNRLILDVKTCDVKQWIQRSLWEVNTIEPRKIIARKQRKTSQVFTPRETPKLAISPR